MKVKNIFLVILLASAFFVSISIADAWPYNKRPRILFSDAYPKAVSGLKNELGNVSAHFYCTHAALEEGSAGGSDLWQFDFSTESGDHRIVCVSMDGKVSVKTK